MMCPQVIGAGREWHKMCFKCMAPGCNAGLDSTTVADRDGKIFCKPCYAKNFGPKVILLSASYHHV